MTKLNPGEDLSGVNLNKTSEFSVIKSFDVLALKTSKEIENKIKEYHDSDKNSFVFSF